MRTIRKLLITIFIAAFMSVGFVACSSSPLRQAASTPAEASTTPETPEAAFAEISYTLDGERKVSKAAFKIGSCTPDTFIGLPTDGHSASALMSASKTKGSARITSNILGDELVSFQGDGLPVYFSSGQTEYASVVKLQGTAFVSKIPEGTSPSIGEVEISNNVEVPATLTATLACSTEN